MTHWAMRYLGVPWESGREGGGAYDCYGLVRAVYRDILGVDLPIVDVTQADPIRLRHAMAEQSSTAWHPVESPQEFDVALMSHGQRPHHVGLWTDADGGRIVHAIEGAGVVAPSLGSLTVAGWRVLGYYRKAKP